VLQQAVALLLMAAAGIAAAQERVIPLDKLQSGRVLQSADVRALQADDFANPGMLWVEKGAKLWSAAAGTEGKSCTSCHGDAAASMKGAATRYPLFDKTAGRLINLENRMQQCRTERQQAPPLRYGSDELLSLSAYVTHQSRGLPVKVDIEGAAKPHFEAGRAYYYERRGQMNLACAHCHEANQGRTLFAEKISQGHPVAYPIYRLEWQSAGTLQRRMRSCLTGVRAELLPYGSQQYLDLELFLMWRAQGLPIETPGVRR
jgi:sulfur-oxidizing protein SoxA